MKVSVSMSIRWHEESMTYSNPYTIGNIKTENLNLLSFSEIMKIYEKNDGGNKR